jgi:hypothetical protein
MSLTAVAGPNIVVLVTAPCRRLAAAWIVPLNS